MEKDENKSESLYNLNKRKEDNSKEKRMIMETFNITEERYSEIDIKTDNFIERFKQKFPLFK